MKLSATHLHSAASTSRMTTSCTLTRCCLGKSEVLYAEAVETERETERRQLYECNVATSCVSMAVEENPQNRWQCHRTRVPCALGEGLSLEVKGAKQVRRSETIVSDWASVRLHLPPNGS